MDDVIFSGAHPRGLVSKNPFGEGCQIDVAAAQPINVTSLHRKLEELTGCTLQVASSPTTSGCRIFVSPAVEEVILREAIKDHDYESESGHGQSSTARDDLLQKLQGDEELTQEDIRNALTLILGA